MSDPTDVTPDLNRAIEALYYVGRKTSDEIAELLTEQMGNDVEEILRKVAVARPAFLADLMREDKAVITEARLYDYERHREQRRRRIRAELDAEEHSEQRAEPPRPVTLADLLDEPEEPVLYRVQDVWPLNGRVVLAAQNKSGKTTMVGNAIRSLVDGDAFLGRYAVDRAQRVVLLDNEMSRNMVRTWLKDQRIQSADRVEVVSLRGALSSFDILDPAVRRHWTGVLRGADVVVFDCLRPALDALGLDENLDAGRFLVALDELCREAGVGELLLVHHMGHSNERSRGSSRIEDWPDVKWKLVKGSSDDERSARYFSAYGRDVDEPEALLLYNPATRHLTIGGGSRKQERTEDIAADVVAFVTAHPGCTKSEVEAAIGKKASDTRAAIKSLIEANTFRVEPGPRNSHLLHLQNAADLFDDELL